MVIASQLESALADREAEDSLAESPFNTDEMLNGNPSEQDIEEHLSALPPEQQEYMAAFMTPEFAQAVGILTGNETLFSYLSSRADSSRVLLPLPREVAEQLIGQMQPPQQEGQPAMQEQPSPMPAPTGVMGTEEVPVM